MKKLQRNERISIVAIGMLLLSILLMLIIIPGVYTGTIPGAKNPGAVIGISLAIIVRLLLFIWYRSILKKTRRDGQKRKVEHILIGIHCCLFKVA